MIYSRQTFSVVLGSILFMLMLLVSSPVNFTSTASHHKNIHLSEVEETALMSYFMNDRVGQIDSLMHCYAENARFNGNVLVASGGVVVFEKSFGYASYAKKKPLVAQSVFQLASVSKQFTAIAVLMLHQIGKINIDDPIGTYIPELPYEGVTIRHLLNHTGGLPDYLRLIEQFWTNKNLPSNEDLISLLARHKLPRFFAPGTRFNYSNTGYALLASVVERVTSESFSSFLRQQIFAPLYLENTFTCAEIIQSKFTFDHVVQGHRGNKSRIPLPVPTVHDGILGDKGIYSSTRDLFYWDLALYTGDLVDNDVLNQAFSPAELPTGKPVPYGFGFRLDEHRSEKVVYHHGTWQGFRTSLMRYPARKNTIILLNNANQRLNTEIVEKIEAIIEAPFQPSYSQSLTLSIINHGLRPTLLRYEKMLADGIKVRPDSSTFYQAAWLLAQMSKNQSSSQVIEFYETIHLAYPYDPLMQEKR